jgi:SAM-dependent methyltransferase
VSERLFSQRATWQEKPALRAIYEALYKKMALACKPGPTLEIGGGSGNFSDFSTEVIATDIQKVPWLDVVCDAHRLPFRKSSFDNIVMFDVLHHLDRPRRFFSDAVEVLRPGGRIVMMEPMITPASWPVYRYLHPEPVRLGADPLAHGDPDPAKDPFDSNQAIPMLLFRREARALTQAFPSLRLRQFNYLGLWAYPLSGGYRKWTLIPSSLVRSVMWFEDKVAPVLGPVFAFRLLAVVERR